jgi:type IV secretory pathway VirB2 component (pilin)
MSHEEVAQLLGAFALDAVDPDEADAIRRHLDECPRCASEVAEHWEVTGLIANVGVDAPAELWDRIAARIEAAPVGARRPAPLQLTSPSTSPSGASRRAYQRVALSVVGTIAAAAAVVAVVLAVQVGRLDQRVGQLAVASRQTGITQAVQAALLDPNVQKVTLAATGTSPTGSSATTGPASPGTGARAAVVVIDPDGSAFVLNTGLPRLAADRTYQLWGVVRGQTVSLGLLGSHPRDVAFTVNPSAPVKVFAVTAEVAGGVVHPTHSPVAESPTTT